MKKTTEADLLFLLKRHTHVFCTSPEKWGNAMETMERKQPGITMSVSEQIKTIVNDEQLAVLRQSSIAQSITQATGITARTSLSRLQRAILNVCPDLLPRNVSKSSSSIQLFKVPKRM